MRSKGLLRFHPRRSRKCQSRLLFQRFQAHRVSRPHRNGRTARSMLLLINLLAALAQRKRPAMTIARRHIANRLVCLRLYKPARTLDDKNGTCVETAITRPQMASRKPASQDKYWDGIATVAAAATCSESSHAARLRKHWNWAAANADDAQRLVALTIFLLSYGVYPLQRLNRRILDTKRDHF